MKLLDIYKEKNSDHVWKLKFFSLADGKSGRVFKYINTNFRTQHSFINQFNEFEKVENVVRESWETYQNYSPEKDKHRVIKLLEAQLFKKQLIEQSSRYVKTKKGILYKKYIDKRYGKNESWIINYLYLLNGNYRNEKNHIFETTKELVKNLTMLDIEINDILLLCKETLKAKKLEDLVRKDLFYVMSFHGDIEFLEVYFKSNNTEKQTLHKYILKNIAENNKLCCISHKYASGGNYSLSMAIDEIKVFYLTFILSRITNNGLEYIYSNLLKTYNKIFSFNEGIVADYLQQESEIFDLILEDVLEIETEEYAVEFDIGREEEEEKIPPYIDVTTKQGRNDANKIFARKKHLARELSEYKCSLESHRNCNEHYFTSKSTNKNYVEVHHLIPKEYSNRFPNSIEVFANYVTLCPNCHELVHKAVDRERKDHLRNLLKNRKDKLSKFNLNIEIEELLKFYGIHD